MLATSINICKSSKHTVIKYRSFSNFEEDKFQCELLCSGLENLESLTNPNDALNVLCSILIRVLSKHAPIKEKRVKREHQPEWISDEIKKLIHERDYLKKKGYHDKYKILRNKVSAFIKKSKRDFYNRAIQENKNSKLIWKNI